MKQFVHRQICRWIFLASSVSLIIIGYVYTYRFRTMELGQVILLTTSTDRSSTQSYECSRNQSALRLQFLTPRPFCLHLLQNDIVSNSIAKSGSWMPSQTKLISLLLANSSSKPAVFLDIGANIGWFTVIMSVLGHKVIAIEPMHDNVNLLRKSLQASQTLQNVIVHEKGLSIIPGECILFSDNSNIGDGHVICGVSTKQDIHALIPAGYSIRQRIHSTQLDALAAQHIDVMKIDVEGSELLAVRSGTQLFDRFQVRHIISEFSPRMLREKQSDPYEYLNFFVSRGYVIRIVTDSLTSLYEQNAWNKVAIYQSEQDLRRLCDRDGLELWFSKV